MELIWTQLNIIVNMINRYRQYVKIHQNTVEDAGSSQKNIYI